MLDAVDPSGPLEAVLLMRPTGAPLATWVKNGGPPDPLTVMSAALFASVGTIVQALGGPSPSSVYAEGSGHCVLAVQADSRAILVVAAPESLRPSKLRREARRILASLRTALERPDAASTLPLRSR